MRATLPGIELTVPYPTVRMVPMTIPSSLTRPRSRGAVRRASAAVAALALGASLTACGALSSSDSGTAAASDGATTGTLAVTASFYPIQYLVEAVGGSHVAVTSATPTNVEPHDFELSPKDVTTLSQAKLIAYVSGFQPSLDDAVSQVSGPSVLDLSSAIDLVHHEGIEDEHESEATDGATEEAHDHEPETDPHFWLDPVRMKAAATAIEEALAKADPANAADYEKNLSTVSATLDSLNTDFASGLAQCERTTFVTSHSAFGYLAERYKLTQTSISGVDPESEPSPADLAAVKKVVEATGTTTIFTEELVSPKTAEAVAAETGAKTAVLNPIESAPESGDYASEMKRNLDALRMALNCK